MYTCNSEIGMHVQSQRQGQVRLINILIKRFTVKWIYSICHISIFYQRGEKGQMTDELTCHRMRQVAEFKYSDAHVKKNV